jgi:cobalamin biosynthesis protein CobD/CbiB
MGFNHWIGLLVVILVITLTFRYLPKITILTTSTLFGSIVLAQYLSETYVTSFSIFFVLAFVFGVVVQMLTIGMTSLTYEIRRLFRKESRGDI